MVAGWNEAEAKSDGALQPAAIRMQASNANAQRGLDKRASGKMQNAGKFVPSLTDGQKSVKATMGRAAAGLALGLRFMRLDYTIFTSSVRKMHVRS